MEQPVAARRQTLCPECRKDMAAVLIPFQGKEIELDICRTCQRLWMDAQENQTYRLDLSETPRGRKPPVIKMTGRGVERLVKEQAKRVRDRWRMGNNPLTWKGWLIIVLILLWKIWHR